LFEIPSQAQSLAFTPDESLLAGGGDAGKVRVWSMADGAQVAALPVDETEISCLGFGPRRGRDYKEDSSGTRQSRSWWLAAGDVGGTVLVWDLESASLQLRQPSGAVRVFTVAFSSDGTLLAAGGQDAMGIWSVHQGRQILRGVVDKHCMALAFSPDQTRLAATGFAMRPASGPHDLARIHLLSLENGRGLRLLRGLTGLAWSVVFSADGKTVAARSQNWQIAVWDRQTGALRSILTPTAGITPDNAALVFSPDGRMLAHASGQDASLWDLETGRRLDSWHLPMGLIDCLGFGPSGQLRLFRHETKQGTKPPAHGVPYQEYPRVGRFRELLPGGEMRTVGEIKRYNRHLCWSVAPSDLSYVVVDGVSADSTGLHESLALFPWAADQPRWSIPKTTPGIGVSSGLDPAVRLLAYGFEPEDPFTLLTLPDGTPTGSLPAFRACSPGAELRVEEHHLAASDRSIYPVVRRGSDVPLCTLGADAFFRIGPSFAFSPDGRSLAWSYEDGTVVVAELDRLNEQLTRFGRGWREASQ
jgi:WD40 repeat protein